MSELLTQIEGHMRTLKQRLHLLIIDELGYMPITREQANLLFQLISMRPVLIFLQLYHFSLFFKELKFIHRL